MGRLSHKGYCARCVGLTQISGKERLEEKLKEFVEYCTGKEVVGVSVIWDFYGQEDKFMQVLNEDMDERIDPPPQGTVDIAARRASASKLTSPTVSPRWDETDTLSARGLKEKETVNRWFSKWERFLLSPPVQRIVKRQHGSTMMAQSCIR
eukprot:CAMPEP_0169278284 /NCGR_PEP_ID=MMETSP1016-20121227/54222_1 /TAXON_ID=342587 /ORGANISM="Karlodinium micrum, Strain CCMP2283" /LENGTH=150 /DNA_ID=CAMNT_0009365993 /DNA_START=178 /DNA_END=626 /DNA_ORIENTATION=-